jgi:hypothetical protein
MPGLQGGEFSSISARLPGALKVPKNTVDSIILKWKKLGTTKTLPRAGHQEKLMATLTELQRFSVEMDDPSRRTTISAVLHQSALYGRGQTEATF